MRRGRGAYRPEFGGEIAGVAPGEGFETEIEEPVQLVERYAHVETGFGGDEAAAAGLLHDGNALGVEPADGFRVYGLDGGAFVGFEAAAEGCDAVFDEVEPGPLHDIVFVVVGGGDDLFGDTEGGADFGAGEFAILEELEVAAGELRLDDFVDAPEEDGAVGGAGLALSVPEGGNDLLALLLTQKLIGPNDHARVSIVFDNATHEGGSGEVGLGGHVGDMERGQAAPEVEGVGEFLEPDFLGEEDLGLEGRLTPGAGVAPADEFVVLNDVLDLSGVEEEDAV